MANNTITFNPDSNVAFGVNLTILEGADFRSTFAVKQENKSVFDLSGYTIQARMKKSVAIGATLGITTSFSVGFTSAYDGKFKVSLNSTQTRSLNEGRYVYNVLVSSGTTVYSIVNGNVLVIAGITTAPS